MLMVLGRHSVICDTPMKPKVRCGVYCYQGHWVTGCVLGVYWVFTVIPSFLFFFSFTL